MTMRLLGLDVGEKRIGIAQSDLLGLTAQPLETYSSRGMKQDIFYLTELAKCREAGAFVCGLPINMNGTEGPRAEKTRAFAAALEKESGIKVLLVDERMTTVSATRILLEGNVSREKRKKVVDKLAAVQILQTYLDMMRNKGE